VVATMTSSSSWCLIRVNTLRSSSFQWATKNGTMQQKRRVFPKPAVFVDCPLMDWWMTFRASSTISNPPRPLLQQRRIRHPVQRFSVLVSTTANSSSNHRFSSLLLPSNDNVKSNWGTSNYVHQAARRWGTSSPPQSSSSSSSPKPSPPHSEDSDNDAVSSSSSSSSSSTTTSDPPMVTWVDDYLPPSIQPYARLARMDKPIGTWLLLWPCFWSTALAAPLGQLPDPYLLSVFAIGAFVMRGAGCTINDMWDSDIDRQVQRTSTRPLAQGDLTYTQAVQFLALQLSVGLGVLLSLQPHTVYCLVWGASSLPLVVLYPLMKRYSNWPQLVLGLTFNWGAWMGWAATYGSMEYTIIGPLYLSGVTWTLVYDTIYANQDKADDARLGLKSTALTFGADPYRHKQILHGFAAMTYLQWLLVGYNHFYVPIPIMDDVPTMMMMMSHNHNNHHSWMIYSMGVTSAYSHLVWQIQTADLDNPNNLAHRFRSNTKVGGIIFVSIVASNVVPGLVT
jgi:4-hydroxybenzoate polyprenyltransferase